MNSHAALPLVSCCAHVRCQVGCFGGLHDSTFAKNFAMNLQPPFYCHPNLVKINRFKAVSVINSYHQPATLSLLCLQELLQTGSVVQYSALPIQ